MPEKCHITNGRYASLVLSPDVAEKRTTFLGVGSDVAESSSDNVVPLAAEFFHVGRSSRMPRCSFENDTPPIERDDVDALRFDRGVDGAVDVRVDNDAFEPDGVSGVERSDDGVDGDCCFFKDERAGGGGRDMAGAEPLRACMGRVVRVRDVTL